jgi:hypothetical protein
MQISKRYRRATIAPLKKPSKQVSITGKHLIDIMGYNLRQGADQ